jgi:hypothetical protein
MAFGCNDGGTLVAIHYREDSGWGLPEPLSEVNHLDTECVFDAAMDSAGNVSVAWWDVIENVVKVRYFVE